MKKNKPIKSVGVIGHPDLTHKPNLVRNICKWVEASGRKVFLDNALSSISKGKSIVLPSVSELSRMCDLMLVIGGDGTVLRVARDTAGSNVPLLGINAGRLGFLTTAPADDAKKALETLWTGKYIIDPLPLIEATALIQDKKIKTIALNDILISRGANPRLIEMKVLVDGEPLTDYRCDGLIVATPAGSTAYSLAAGGAVVSPRAEVLTLNPICPQALSNRPLVVGFSSTIEVTILKHRAETYLSADGQMQAQLEPNDTVKITRSRQKARLIRLQGNSFFETLRHKLNWTGSHA